MQRRFFKAPDGGEDPELALERGDHAAKPGDLIVLDSQVCQSLDGPFHFVSIDS